MKYRRDFLTLKQKDEGFSLKGKPMGKCLIETRGENGKIAISVQNLKPEVMYRAFLLESKGSDTKSLALGTIIVDKNGKSDLKLDVRTNDVLGSGASLEDFNIVAILVDSKNQTLTPLEGYIGEQVNWDTNFKNAISPTETVAEPKPETNVKSISEPIPTPAPASAPAPSPVYEAEEEEQPPIVPSLEGKIPEKTVTQKLFELTNHTEIEKILIQNAKIIPFTSQKKEFSWVRISLKETIHLPINFLALSNDPFIVSCYKKHKHLIFGIYEGAQKEYLLGLPDVYSHRNKLKANARGFMQFKCCEDTTPKDKEGGYWILPVYVV